jgi:hypothetical protein
MKIIVVSKNSNDRIQIDLIDNPPIARWFNNSRHLQKTLPITGVLHLDKAGTNLIPTSNYQTLYSDLLTAIEKLKMLLEEKEIVQFQFPEIPTTFNRSQHWCNSIHNVFVDVSIFLEKNYSNYWNKTTEWDSIVFETIKNINVLVHKLEKWASTTEHYRYIKNHYSHTYLQTEFNTSDHGLNLWFEITPEEQALYHSTLENDTFYNVVFSNEILGKTFYRSFIDEEPPGSPAISGIDKTWGNIDIKLDSQRTTIFKDAQFQNWLESVATDKSTAPLEFPVGSINPNSDLDYFVKRKTTEVVFHFVD